MLRYRPSLEQAMRRALTHLRLDHTILQFERRLSRRQGGGVVKQSWFPGYAFLHLDIVRDFWQPVYQAPGAVTVLGGPTALPQSVFHDLVARCPVRVDTLNDALTVIPAGSRVRLIHGPMKGWEGVVSRSQGDTAWVELIAFGALRQVQIATRHVLILEVSE